MTPIKAYTKAEIAALYQVSVWVLRQWMKKFDSKVGEYKGKCYTPAQVEIIFEHLGEPGSE